MNPKKSIFFSMKNILNFKSLSIVMAIATAFAITQACVTKDDLTKDFSLRIDLDLIKVPMSLQIIDGNFASGMSPKDVTIELVGPDKDKFYSTMGEKKIVVTEGFVDLAVRKTDAPTPQKPLKLTVIARAPGYLRTIKTFTLTSTDKTQFEAMSMVNLTNPPAGVTVKKGTVTVGANGAVATTLATSPTTSREGVSVEIPAGTLFKDKDGNVLTGTVEATMVHFDNQDPASLAAFPGGLFVNSSKDVTGVNIGSGQFTTMGLLSLDMTVGGKEVKGFSGTGVKVAMELNETSINPEKGRAIAVGDSLPVWSLDETDNSWVKEKVGVVTGTATNMKLSYDQNHLSFWNLDYFYGPNCWQSGTVTVAGVAVPGNYYVEVVNASTNQILKSLYMYLANGETLNFYNAPSGLNYYFRVNTGYYYYCPGTILGTSTQFQLCAGNATANFNNFTVGGSSPTLTTKATAVATCTGKPYVRLSPSMTVYYKEANSPCAYWLYGGSMVSGNYVSTSFKPGKTYDIMVILGWFPVQFKRTIPATASGTYQLDFNLEMPSTMCAYF